METNAATIVLIPYNNLDRSLCRLQRDIVPSLLHHPDWRFQLIVVDNSEQRLDPLAAAVSTLPWPSEYVWSGRNLMYGPALNIAAARAEHPIMVYACTNHGKMVDPSWIEDLARPFWHDARVAITGHPSFISPDPAALGLRDTGYRFHIQGGVLAASTDVIRRYPYHEGEYAHAGSDIWQSYRLMQEGFVLHNVPSVVSVWRANAPSGQWKYVHDHSEG